MDQKITQKIAIGLVSISLLALIGFNIYEYKKVKYIPQIMDIEILANKAATENPSPAKINPATPVSIQVSTDILKETQVNKNSPDDPQYQPDPQKKELKPLNK
jgi:hypothetical protein